MSREELEDQSSNSTAAIQRHLKDDEKGSEEAMGTTLSQHGLQEMLKS